MTTTKGAIWSRYAREHASPLLSVVIPVYNLAGDLGDCLDSIARQKRDDIEIVMVDGGSTDGSLTILTGRSAKDPRITVIPTARIGPGRARNLGAENATGEYIWFIDGDDVITADSIPAIADRLEVLRPDVLFIGYEDLHQDGTLTPGPGHKLMRRDAGALFSLADHPWATEFSMASWNKVVRREFFLSMPVRFLADWPHEDVPVSCLMLMKADKLSLLDQVCYRHTMQRPGSAMASSQRRRHFRLLSSYEMVLAAVADPAIPAAVRLAFFQRAIWHYSTILDTQAVRTSGRREGSYVAAADRRAFFARMHDDFLRFRPAGYRYPPGLRGVKYRLVRLNAYRTYTVLSEVNRLRVRPDLPSPSRA